MHRFMISLADIQAAQARLKPFLHRTPVHLSQTLSQRFGLPVFLKMEIFQKTGSFKSRAAFNRLLRLTDSERRRGAVAVSGGNFAQGMAFGGQVLGIDVLLCMPESSPRKSLEAARSYGAKIELYPDIRSAFEAAERHQHGGRIYVHPFDEPDVIAGNGSIGLEILEDIPQTTDVIVSVGGGGLMSGVTLALKFLKPSARIYTVETQGANALELALKAGKIVEMQPTSLAKTLGAPFVSSTALALAQAYVEKHIVVTDHEAYEAQLFLLERAKILCELSASCTLAAAEKIKNRLTPKGCLVLILCGGNVSLEDLAGYREKFET